MYLTCVIKTMFMFECQGKNVNSGLSILEAHSGGVQALTCMLDLCHEIHHSSIS